jgi:RNA polymerase sigma-70 factor (ECF subfamily)
LTNGASQQLLAASRGFSAGEASCVMNEDQALVAALRARRPEALAALFDRYSSHVYRVLLRTLGPDGDLADLVHDVFVVAFEDIDDLKDASKLKGWLASVAVFTARGCIRRRQRWRWLSRLTQAEVGGGPRPTSGPEVDEAVRSTSAILERLPVDERMAFALRFVDGMKLEEVAEACRTSLATVKRRLARAERRFLELARANPALQEWLSRGTRWSDGNT